IIPNIDLAWEEIAYFQVGDNPISLAHFAFHDGGSMY
ncbi:unnamed protein product, partial [marine sediment metagenome]